MLIPRENWYATYVKICNYRCRGCALAYREAHYGVNREKILAQRKVHYEANREKIQAYREQNRDAIRIQKRVYQQQRREEALKLVATIPSCAWEHLGGCDGELEFDHIEPVRVWGKHRTNKARYAASGINLVRWILQNPTSPKLKGLQLLCNEHNRFKSSRGNEEAQELWKQKFCPEQLAIREDTCQPSLILQRTV